MDQAQILSEALRDLHKNETFERALGRILRRHGYGYVDYLRLVDALRDQARKQGIDLLVAAQQRASGAEDLGVD